jgi:hypothetical protein
LDRIQIDISLTYGTNNAHSTGDCVELDLVLPYSEYLPAESRELSKASLVPDDIAMHLVVPEWRQLVLPNGESPAVPEVTIYENGYLGLPGIRSLGNPAVFCRDA